MTFDLTFNSSDNRIWVGNYYHDYECIATSNPVSDHWALNVTSVNFTKFVNNSLSGAVTLDAGFPYMAVPADVYKPYYSELTSLGFICFRSAFSKFTVCEAVKPCNQVGPHLPDFTFNVTSDDGYWYEVYMSPNEYLFEKSNNFC